MISIKKANSDNLDFQTLVSELDFDLTAYYKEENAFYEKLNNTESIKHVVVAYNEAGLPVGCGGIKAFSKNEVEIKRMYVSPRCRGKGVATVILEALESWSIELGFSTCILETLKAKPYAISFYKKNNYQEIPNFGDYKIADNSICFQKKL
ncbi:GNAT family N-acetyltransferase [Algibacter miyuki]|uniref:GNAT family N-acetyltransferase n=1 Tax=Algibacter miyuki TaxID=1306933 RepID=A0ABV5H2K8_9FLAO|nr:GNAT family N-acetyltransferase [Algibacter miyuki]MDN3664533.1 GNAT family N-acetyltransferase [Algibacter miyuki]